MSTEAKEWYLGTRHKYEFASMQRSNARNQVEIAKRNYDEAVDRYNAALSLMRIAIESGNRPKREQNVRQIMQEHDKIERERIKFNEAVKYQSNRDFNKYI